MSTEHDIWIIQARLKELSDIILYLSSREEHYSEGIVGGVEGAYHRASELFSVMAHLEKRKIELLAELNTAESKFYGWHEEELGKDEAV